MLGHRVLALDAEKDRLDLLLGELVQETAPALAVFAVGVDATAILLVTAGDNGAVRFAAHRAFFGLETRAGTSRRPRATFADTHDSLPRLCTGRAS